MFKNRITACMYTQNPEQDNILQRLETLFIEDYSKRSLDWVISSPGRKILQYSEQSEIHWNGTLAYWQMISCMFYMFNVEVKYELLAKEIVIDIYNEDTSICIIINFDI